MSNSPKMALVASTSMPMQQRGENKILLVGNPNVGKSTIFGALTGQYANVSNYPGTTVEVSRGQTSCQGSEYTVVDTPGTNSLIPADEAEQVTRDILLTTPEARVIQVAEMRNIRRAVLLSLQLAELQSRFVLDLNMSDEARTRGVLVDTRLLSDRLGIEVVETVAVHNKGIGRLTRHIDDSRLATVRCTYPADIESGVGTIEALLPEDQRGKRGIALMFLAGDETIETWARQRLDQETRDAIGALCRKTARGSHQSLRYRINTSRLAFVDRLLEGVVRGDRREPLRALDLAGRYSMHPVWGIPVLAAVLLTAYYAVGVLGAGVMVDFMETHVFGTETASVALNRHVLTVDPSSFSSRKEESAPADGATVLAGRLRREPDGVIISLSVMAQAGKDLEATGQMTPYWYLSGGGTSAYGGFVHAAGASEGAYTAEVPGGLLDRAGGDGRLVLRAWSGFLNRHVFNFLHVHVPARVLRDLVVGEYGIVTMGLTYAVAIVLPIVGVFFIFFSFLEDSGYLPRLAIMVNVLFKRLGLNGKAVLPMVLGLGCDTMATMTTRIMETRKERIIVTLLLALAVPCSAQLGVILGMLGGLSLSASLVWAGVIVAVVFLVGRLASEVLPGRGSDFILEVPPLRIPQVGNIVVKTIGRIEWYLKEAVPIFLLGTLVLFVLDELQMLEVLERAMAPLIQDALGLPREATSAFLVGFFRRDYGAAGLYAIFQPRMTGGEVSPITEIQIVVSMVTMTLFVPCVANVFMMVKERGWKTATAMVAFIFPFAFIVGALVNFGMRTAYGLP